MTSETSVKIFLQTCDNWDTDYNSYNWEPEFMTIFGTWQLILTLDSIRNSCDVLKPSPNAIWNFPKCKMIKFTKSGINMCLNTTLLPMSLLSTRSTRFAQLSKDSNLEPAWESVLLLAASLEIRFIKKLACNSCFHCIAGQSLVAAISPHSTIIPCLNPPF